MIGNNYGEYFISKMTLGLLEDSGWYKVDYKYSERVPWGYQKGCEFLEKSCINKKPIEVKKVAVKIQTIKNIKVTLKEQIAYNKKETIKKPLCRGIKGASVP